MRSESEVRRERGALAREILAAACEKVAEKHHVPELRQAAGTILDGVEYDFFMDAAYDAVQAALASQGEQQGNSRLDFSAGGTASSDPEMPGMWDSADLGGGVTDAQGERVAGDALAAAGRTELDMLVRKAAMYDWLVAGGIYRLGYDNVGGPSLDRWDEVIPMLMQSCAGPNCTGHPHSDACRAEYARCLELGGDDENP